MRQKKTWSILKGTFSEFSEDNVLRLSAALAYYSMFSLAPLLVIAVGVAGLVLGQQQVRQQVEQQLQGILGPRSAQIIDSMMAAQTHRSSVSATVVGIVVLLFGAAGVFGQLQDSLNTIWEVKSKPGAGIWKFLQSRFLSLAMVLGSGFLLLVSLLLTTALSAATGALGHRLALSAALAHGLSFLVSFAVITLLFAMIFKYLPDVKVPFRKVWVGAIVTALLFTVGKFLLGWYLGRAGTTSSYGQAASVVAILMWVYYASVILFLGAEFTQVYARQTGARVVPSQYAVPVTPRERAEQGIPKEGGAPAGAASGVPPSGARPRPALPSIARAGLPAVREERPWPYLGLLLAAGFATGVMLKSRWAVRNSGHDGI